MRDLCGSRGLGYVYESQVLRTLRNNLDCCKYWQELNNPTRQYDRWVDYWSVGVLMSGDSLQQSRMLPRVPKNSTIQQSNILDCWIVEFWGLLATIWIVANTNKNSTIQQSNNPDCWIVGLLACWCLGTLCNNLDCSLMPLLRFLWNNSTSSICWLLYSRDSW